MCVSSIYFVLSWVLWAKKYITGMLLGDSSPRPLPFLEQCCNVGYRPTQNICALKRNGNHKSKISCFSVAWYGHIFNTKGLMFPFAYDAAILLQPNIWLCRLHILTQILHLENAVTLVVLYRGVCLNIAIWCCGAESIEKYDQILVFVFGWRLLFPGYQVMHVNKHSSRKLDLSRGLMAYSEFLSLIHFLTCLNKKYVCCVNVFYCRCLYIKHTGGKTPLWNIRPRIRVTLSSNRLGLFYNICSFSVSRQCKD